MRISTIKRNKDDINATVIYYQPYYVANDVVKHISFEEYNCFYVLFIRLGFKIDSFGLQLRTGKTKLSKLETTLFASNSKPFKMQAKIGKLKNLCYFPNGFITKGL